MLFTDFEEVGCHAGRGTGFLAIWVLSAIAQLCLTLQSHGLQPTRLLCSWNSPGKNTGVGFHFLLQGIFLNQGSNPHLLSLLHWQMDSLPLAPPGKPQLWTVAIAFFNVSCALPGETGTVDPKPWRTLEWPGIFKHHGCPALSPDILILLAWNVTWAVSF